jgi:succinate dehydrogenase/fumarate reductase-like Fe-S protein
MPSAPLPGHVAQFSSPLYAYKKFLKRSTPKLPVVYTAKDNLTSAMQIRTGAAGFGQYTASRWYLKMKVDKQNRNRLEGIYECVLCASCTGSCPSYWWNRETFLGPAVLLQSYRWLIEPLDRDFDQRLDLYEHGTKLNMCHNIFNCTITCPKYLNPGFATKEIKRLVSPLSPATTPAEHVQVSH